MDGWERPDNAHAEAGWLVPTLTARHGNAIGRSEEGALVPALAMDWTQNGASAHEELSPSLRIGSTIGIPSPPIVAIHENHRGNVSEDDAVPGLTGGGGKPGQGYPAVAYPLAMRGRDDGAELEMGDPDVYNSLRAGDGGSSRQNGLLTPALAVRRLTPRECERLMSWPDDWTRWGDDGEEIADSHRYRMCGNGVVSNVTEWIGRRLP